MKVARENPIIMSTDESITFGYGQSSHGVASSIQDTPRDVLSIRKSNAVVVPNKNLEPWITLSSFFSFKSRPM